MPNDHYKSSNNNKTVELPISAPLFEGHLYLRQESRWLWRMFRFDGTTLTCLSEKKFKLPPSTLRLPGTESCTSLLLAATPKDKNVRITQSIPTFGAQPPQVSYYQLPKWTIDMVNVSSISILKNGNQTKLQSLLQSSSDKSKTFCIRTFQGERLVMRAHKHQDLERWLFVLTKMWKFAQSIRQFSTQIVTNETTLSKQIPNDYHQQQQMMYHSSDNNNNNQPLFLEKRKKNGEEGNEGVPQVRDNSHSYSPQQQQHPILPEEKVNWIRAWAQSLGELSVYDNEIKTEPSVKYEEEGGGGGGGGENILASYPVQPKEYPLDSNQYLVAHNNNRQRRSKPHMYNTGEVTAGEGYLFPCTHYFQDTNTEDDEESSNHANKNDGLLTYHTSIKGKNVKFGSTSSLHIINDTKEEPMIPALFEFNKLSIDTSSPLEKLGAYPKQQQQQQQQHKRNTHSFQPSTRPYHSNKRASVYVNQNGGYEEDDDVDDENMSLAEVKQFLKDKYTSQPQLSNTTVH